MVEYYRRRAAGGAGLIIGEASAIEHKAVHAYPDVPNLYGTDALQGWKKILDAVHVEGAKMMPQLWHSGGIRRPGIEPGGSTPGYSPSGMKVPGVIVGRAMTKQDIDDVVSAFACAARDAKRIGFDAVEIHGAHGYLIDQFLWEGTNRREDEYGGDLRSRSRLAIEVISAVRETVGPNFPICFRWSQWKQQDYSAKLVSNPKELERFLTPLKEAGIDIFHCSTRRFWEPEFEGSDLNLAGWTKKVTGNPVIAVGSVSLNRDFLPANQDLQFESAELASIDKLLEKLDRNEFDIVAVGRAMIANPDWANQIKENQFDQLKPYEKGMLESLN